MHIFFAVILFLFSWAAGFFGLHPIISSAVYGTDLSDGQILLSIILLVFWLAGAYLAGKVLTY